MVSVCGEPLLSRTIRLLKPHASEGIVIVGGYRAERLSTEGHLLVHNHRWHEQNILCSLFSADEYLRGEVLVSYGDTFLTKGAIRPLLGKLQTDLCALVDTGWRESYVGRLMHPTSEAEKVVLKGNSILKIGKSNILDSEAHGEFPGLLRMSAHGADQLRAAFVKARNRYRGGAFGTARMFEQAYLTDLLQFMIDQGQMVGARCIQGGWREIDTQEDIQRTEAWYARSN